MGVLRHRRAQSLPLVGPLFAAVAGLLDIACGLGICGRVQCPALVVASGCGLSEIVRVLVHAGAHPDVRDLDQDTPLILAAGVCVCVLACVCVCVREREFVCVCVRLFACVHSRRPHQTPKLKIASS